MNENHWVLHARKYLSLRDAFYGYLGFHSVFSFIFGFFFLF